jgi:SAM-dependent MidA family methyltransferase
VSEEAHDEAPLAARIRRLIQTSGPLSVFDYMGLCLADPKHGYYMRAEPFGAGGDFITAPEVSQLFGELIGAWLIHAHEAIGAPQRVHVVELGPGRGTLMADILRVARLRPAFRQGLQVHLVETSPRLRAVQAKTLGTDADDVRWHDTLASLPDDAPLLLVANEFFDALPIRQYVRTEGQWLERCIGLDAEGRLRFASGTGRLGEHGHALRLPDAPEGAILETQPLANALMQDLAARLAGQGGVLLAIDYGYARTDIGDTLQALRAHRHVPVLEAPGLCDLTAHVNFEALARAAMLPGLRPRRLLTQGEFLLSLGLLERAGRLGAGKSAQEQDRIRGEVERLAAPGEMGELFKVLAVTSERVSLPPFDPV